MKVIEAAKVTVQTQISLGFLRHDFDIGS